MRETAPADMILVDRAHVSCEGQGGALGHPRVWYVIGEGGYAECGYCDRVFILKGGPADASAGRGETLGEPQGKTT
jgi:uncharacterized Zn-finger protein